MGGPKLDDKKKKDLNDVKRIREAELEMKRMLAPKDFSMQKHPIAIDVVDRTYGIICECGSIEFDEDEKFEKLTCSGCNKLLAIRAAEIGWLTSDL